MSDEMAKLILAKLDRLQEDVAELKRERSAQPPLSPGPTVPDELILVGEAAKLAKRSERQIRRWIHGKGIGHRTETGRLMVSKRQLLDLIYDRR